MLLRDGGAYCCSCLIDHLVVDQDVLILGAELEPRDTSMGKHHLVDEDYWYP